MSNKVRPPLLDDTAQPPSKAADEGGAEGPWRAKDTGRRASEEGVGRETARGRFTDVAGALFEGGNRARQVLIFVLHRGTKQ